MLRLLILLLISIKTYAQPNVWLSGHLIDGANEEIEVRIHGERQHDNKATATTKADKKGNFNFAFRIQFGQPITMTYGGSNFLMYLHPQDSLKITASKRVFDVFMFPKNGTQFGRYSETSVPPVFEGKGAALNQFLYQNGLYGRDSLQEKPIIKRATTEMYSTIVDDNSEYTWAKYQKQFGLADTAQSIYVQASLAGQAYFRKHTFVDNQPEIDNELGQSKPVLKIIPNDDAIYSDIYLNALLNYFKINYLAADDSTAEKYENVAATIRNLPKTQEYLLANVIMRRVFTNDSDIFYDKIFARFEKDFPSSTYTRQIKRDSWAHRLLEKGIAFPEIVFQNINSQDTDVTKFRGKPTAILFWNTWCDSCQTRLNEFTKLAESYEDSSMNFIAIAANNQIDSWQAHIKNVAVPNLGHYHIKGEELGILRGAMADKNFPTNAHLLLLDIAGIITQRVNLSDSAISIKTQISK